MSEAESNSEVPLDMPANLSERDTMYMYPTLGNSKIMTASYAYTLLLYEVSY